jgi:hypothetical protein
MSTGGKPFFLPVVKIMYSQANRITSAVVMNWADSSVKSSPLDIKHTQAKSGAWEIVIKGKGTLLVDPRRETMNWRIR